MADEQSALTRVWQAVKRYAAKVWNYLKVAKMEYIVMASLFALDLISKAIVNATTGVNQTVVLIPNFLNIHNIHNYDAAFGSEWMTNALGSMGSRILFSIFAVIASVVFIFILIRNKGGNRLLRVAFAMLVAGALGNCIDRMFLGYVRDFVEFVYFGFTIGGHDSFYVFNIADAELVIGVILVLIYFIFMYRDKPEDKKAVLVDGADGTTATDDGIAPSADTADTADGSTDATGETTSAEETSAIDRDSGGDLSDETPTEQTPTEENSDTAEIIPATDAPTTQPREEQAAAADTEQAGTPEITNAEQPEQPTENAQGAQAESRASSGVKKSSAAKKTSGAARSSNTQAATKTVRKTTAGKTAASKTTASKTAAGKSTSGKTTAGKNTAKTRAAKPAAKTTDGENATE